MLTKQYDDDNKNISIINIFGKEGRGRLSLVKKVSSYLRFRQYFPKGIFFIDMDISKSFIEDLNNIQKEMIDWNSIKKLSTFRHKKLSRTLKIIKKTS